VIEEDQHGLLIMKSLELTKVMTHLLILLCFSDCDPTIFKVAVKESKCRKAMDAEIRAIEKNET